MKSENDSNYSNKIVGGPYRELKTIVWKATKQALEWTLEETEKPLTCQQNLGMHVSCLVKTKKDNKQLLGKNIDTNFRIVI